MNLIVLMNKQVVLRANEGPRILFEARKVAGSATYKAKQYKLFSLKVNFYIQFIPS